MSLCELRWGQIASRAVRPLGVVLDTPFLNQLPGVAHRNEPVLIQEFVAEPAIDEALDIGILH